MAAACGGMKSVYDGQFAIGVSQSQGTALVLLFQEPKYSHFLTLQQLPLINETTCPGDMQRPLPLVLIWQSSLSDAACSRHSHLYPEV